MTSPSSRPAAVLIVNPNAGRLSERTRSEVVGVLRAKFDLEVFETTARDHGIEIAAKSAESGVPLTIAFGGDGHINEVANGVAGSGCALGVIPGGTMNVFARALGIPMAPFDAVERLLAAGNQPARTVSLGRIDDRYFTFAAGCGFDAEAAERVERHIRSKRRFGEMFFYWSAFRVLSNTYRRRNPTMILSGNFGEIPVSMAIASNSGPYAYFAGRSVNLAPKVELDGGLDVFSLRKMRLEALPFYAWRVAVSGDLVHHRDVFYRSDLSSFELRSEAPFRRHVDGEPLAPTRVARFSVERDVLRVQA